MHLKHEIFCERKFITMNFRNLIHSLSDEIIRGPCLEDSASLFMFTNYEHNFAILHMFVALILQLFFSNFDHSFFSFLEDFTGFRQFQYCPKTIICRILLSWKLLSKFWLKCRCIIYSNKKLLMQKWNFQESKFLWKCVKIVLHLVGLYKHDNYFCSDQMNIWKFFFIKNFSQQNMLIANNYSDLSFLSSCIINMISGKSSIHASFVM